MDKVVDDCHSVVIKRTDAEDAVIMSKSYYDSLMETVYLLRSPTNAKHLMDVIAQHQSGLTVEHDLLDAWASLG